MTSFGWKRKAGDSVSKAKAKEFEENSKEEDLTDLENGTIDWLHLAPVKKVFTLEDAVTKSTRLQKEGEVLAEAERYWEAIIKWDNALQLTPEKASLHEMKAQVYLQLNEPFPALASARKAVECARTWAVAYVTMGRAQLCIGEVRMAVKSFSRAVHLNPPDEEVWREDLAWAVDLWNKHKEAIEKEEAEKEAQSTVRITELSEEAQEGIIVKRPRVDDNFMLPSEDIAGQEKEIKYIPKNMVKLRF